MTLTERILKIVEPIIFGIRWWTLSVLVLVTIFMGWQASMLQPNAGWLKMVPQDHPYMQTFTQYFNVFGGANRVLVSIHNNKGTIYQPGFMGKIESITSDVFNIEGVERSSVKSIFTPQILYLEVTPTGMKGGTVVPSDYPAHKDSPAMMKTIRNNVSKANIIGRLVSNDQQSALVLADLIERNPSTGQKISYVKVGHQLEQIRHKYEGPNTSVEIIGFAKVVSDMTNAAYDVVAFFFITLFLTFILLWLYLGSLYLSILPLICAFCAVIWELGILHLIGLGLDPFAILVPFLILAISTSHGVQYANAWASEAMQGLSPYDAGLASFRRLAIPGTVALFTALAGIMTIYLIDIEAIRDMALNAAFGLISILFTNKVMMPILLTTVHVSNFDKFKNLQKKRTKQGDALWRLIAHNLTRRGPAIVVMVIFVLLLAWGLYQRTNLVIGSAQPGVPELKPDSRFNQDARFISANYSIALDQFNIIAETPENGCVMYPVMSQVDDFAWYMRNQPGVQSTMTLMDFDKLFYSSVSEGRLNAHVLPRSQYALAAPIQKLPSTSGLYNPDCSALNVFVFTTDHKASTIEHLVDAVNHYKDNDVHNKHVNLRLASGNVGVMAAQNQVVEAKEMPIVLWVYVVILIFLFLSFRTFSGMISVLLPLALVSFMGYGVMALLGIGLKVATLPVIALGAGIGVDYGIYIYHTTADGLRKGMTLEQAYYETLQKTGRAVVFIGISLAIGVATWIFSALQFQIDMGIVLLFLFLGNMFAAVLIIPALAHFFAKEEYKHMGRELMGGADDEADTQSKPGGPS